ncbi:hypothetical protein SIN8267_00144 [Sinobacterium norvegicum]|uniref:Phytanoyl-CoA dioxygenase n=1 Tax=Sinobacterium norvegicum TaxID=1641715 RepID=A0ABN8ECS9_9GAMM|nr:hypothetical protein SIN8267_00144 [Sinobacterium norvegicum]
MTDTILPNTLQIQNQPLVVSRSDEDAVLLQQRFQHYGYLYFQNHVDKQKCQQLMLQFLDALSPHIVLDPQTGLPALGGEPFFETDPIWDQLYPKIQSMEAFHDFFHQADLHQLMQIVAGDKPFVYPMKMARMATPKKIGYETPPHQDAHSHQAGETMAGMWVALHDVTTEMGRLKLLPHSHKKGVRPVFEAQGVGGIQCEIYDDETLWHTSDVSQGDVIIFHSCCVHKAEPNTAQSAARLSIDTRFCDYGAPLWSLNLEPHHGWRIDDLDWSNIYKDWKNQHLQYYWQDYPNTF